MSIQEIDRAIGLLVSAIMAGDATEDRLLAVHLLTQARAEKLRWKAPKNNR